MATEVIDKTLDELKRRGRLPSPVVSWTVEVGPDASDQPAAWVLVALAQDTTHETKTLLRGLIRKAVLESKPDLSWAYVRFHLASEDLGR